MVALRLGAVPRSATRTARLEQMVQGVRNMIGVYKQNGIPIEEGGVQAAFGCNFEGDIPVEDVLDDRAPHHVDRRRERASS